LSRYLNHSSTVRLSAASVATRTLLIGDLINTLVAAIGGPITIVVVIGGLSIVVVIGGLSIVVAIGGLSIVVAIGGLSAAIKPHNELVRDNRVQLNRFLHNRALFPWENEGERVG
jgi:hypothetical protein